MVLGSAPFGRLAPDCERDSPDLLLHEQVAILQFQGARDDFVWPLVLLQERSHWTPPLGLAQFRGLFQTNWPALTAVVVMATIPVLVLYIFCQRYFTAGVASGVKG